MKKIERLLALLMVLAMLFTTLGLAEEVAPAEPAEEAVEVAEPAVEEEPVEEELVEEEPAAEEPAAEEVPSMKEESADREDFDYIDKPCTAVESDGYHSFENGKCTACGYKCPHGRVNTMYALDVVNKDGMETVESDMDPVFAPIDGEKHLAKMRYRYVVTQCLDCNKLLKKTKLKKETTYAAEVPHVFGDGVRCYMCGYRNDTECAHTNFTTEEHEVIDGYEPIDGVKHLVKGTKYPNAKKCLDCGAFFDDGVGEAFTREELHRKRKLVQEYDDYFDYGYIGWDEANGFEYAYGIEVYCDDCGYNTPSEGLEHDHVWVDCTEEWDERCTPIANDNENHTRVVDTYTGKQCSICGIHLEMKKTKETSTKEPHVWNSGFCMKCGMSQMCVHPREIDDGVYTANEVKAMGLLDEAAPDTFTALDEARHMVSSTLYRVYVCDYCCVPLRYELVGGEDVKVEGHEWKNGKCTLCGYVCKHESKYTDFYGEVTYSQKKDKKGNVDKNVHTATPKQEGEINQSCSNCDKVYTHKKIKKAFEESHSFISVEGKIVCSKCGYMNECAHTNARETAEVNFYVTEIVNTGDPNNHEVEGTYSVYKVCPDCGYVFEDTVVEYSDGPAPHMFNDAGICQICGYAKEDAAVVALSVQKTKQLAVGEKWTPAMNIAPKTATGVSYKSSNTKIFDVNATTGEVTAKKAGKAKLTASYGSKIKATCTITVKKAATSITLPKEKTLGVGQRISLPATFAPKKSFANLNYTSDDPDCVKVVDAAVGEIAAVSAGTAHITATTVDGKYTAECAVTVTEAPESVSLVNLPKQMGKGEKLTIEAKLLDADGKETAGYVRFMSSNTKILKVGEYDGKVTASGTGTAKIYAFAYNGEQTSMDVEVKKAPKGVTLSPSESKKTIKAGETYIFKAETSADSASQLTVTSSKDSVAKVEPTENPGEYKITGVATGKATITIKTFNKKSKKITVTVQ